MRYVSTRGRADELGFEDVMLAGLARDGGLYVPKVWPEFSAEDFNGMAGRTYCEVALDVMAPFIGEDIPRQELAALIEAAYAGFETPEVAPLHQLEAELWVLELFHGPTLAFKDVAMQLLARLMDRVLAKRGERLTIIGATSGDTGGAAVEAFRGREAVDLFVLHPKGRVSDVQRRQMTSAQEQNVFNIAIEGTFDDCQALVKALFNDLALRDRLSPGWRQLDQLGAYHGANGLLHDQRAGAGARPMALELFGPYRKFRRYFCGLRRHADGTSDFAPRYRHERK